MYLLSTGSSGGFTEADETAVRAVTEAGMAALASDINSSPVSLGPSLLSDTRLKEALDGPAVPEPVAAGEIPAATLQEVFVQVANEGLLNEYPRMSMAITDKGGNILARTGLAPEVFDELIKMPAVDTALASEEAALLSASLAGKLHAVKLSRSLTDATQRRLITIRAVELGGGSFFRRVVGTHNPGGLVRDGEVLGDAIGGAKPEELVAFAAQHTDNIPPEGASAVFLVGEGASARIGSAARVPGPAGKGKGGTLFVVLSKNTLASTQQDMATALQVALDSGGLGQLNWLLVGGLLVISLGLTFYLPFIEYNGPLRRLSNEFNGITEGRQHELYHDTYGGELGKVARSAATAMEALRVSWENELMDSDAELSDVAPRRTRSTRSLRAAPKRRSRAHKSAASEPEPKQLLESDDDSGLPEAIDLPSADTRAKIERHAAAEAPVLPPDAPPAPAFSDEIAPTPLSPGDSSDSVSFADLGGGQDRESYYRGIYDEFVETKGACGEATEGFTYEKFAKKLRKQSDTLMARPEVTDVQFSVYVKDGKAALRAKVIKS
ncbi:MXAN_5187 family protein [Enhygromyxa salina]|nr:MXAN_5187 family protein [Enhygromyxa salina]